MADLTKLRILKDKLVKATDFNEPCSYFLDHFEEEPDFIKIGRKTEAAFLRPVIEQVALKLLGKQAEVTHMMMTEIRDYHFFHGACFIDGRPASLLYFSDIDMGIMTFLQSLQTMEVVYTRFSCVHPSDIPSALH